jgi:hypothetical protein
MSSYNIIIGHPDVLGNICIGDSSNLKMIETYPTQTNTWGRKLIDYMGDKGWCPVTLGALQIWIRKGPSDDLRIYKAQVPEDAADLARDLALAEAEIIRIV